MHKSGHGVTAKGTLVLQEQALQLAQGLCVRIALLFYCNPEDLESCEMQSMLFTSTCAKLSKHQLAKTCDSSCDSNFGPDQLHNRIHFNIRQSFDLCMYMHRSTLVSG